MSGVQRPARWGCQGLPRTSCHRVGEIASFWRGTDGSPTVTLREILLCSRTCIQPCGLSWGVFGTPIFAWRGLWLLFDMQEAECNQATISLSPRWQVPQPCPCLDLCTTSPQGQENVPEFRDAPSPYSATSEPTETILEFTTDISDNESFALPPPALFLMS